MNAAEQAEENAVQSGEWPVGEDVFTALAAQPDLLSESSRFIANTPDPFAPEDAKGLQPVSREDTDPLSNPIQATKSAEHVLSTPLNNPTNSTLQNLAGAYAGAGQGPGGVSTPNPSGGGGASGGGSANLHLPSPTQVQQMLSGANSQTTIAAPTAPNNATLAASPHAAVTGAGAAMGSGTGSSGGGLSVLRNDVFHNSGSGSGSGSSSAGPSIHSSPLLLSGSGTGSGELTGSGTTFGAYEGGIYDGFSAPAVSPLIRGVAGTAFTNTPVMIFTDGNPNSTSNDFTATINWGDNTPTTNGTIIPLSGGGFSVAGSHTYTASGTYSVQVKITDRGSGGVDYGSATVVVSDAPLTAMPANINATEGNAFNNVVVATFTSANPYAPSNSFSATIDWGDGSTPGQGMVSGSNGSFTVTGSHTYTEGGNYQVSVTIQSLSSNGSSAAVASTATVTDLPLTGTGITLTPAVTGSNTTLTASFAEANTSEDPSNYLAQIDWGDGWIDDATVSGSNGNYSLNGSHVYDHPGNYTVTVTVTDTGGATLTQTGSVSISAAALSASGTTLTATAGQALSNVPIASFTDGNTDQMNDYYYGPISGYTVTINWGDGTGLDTSAVVMGDDDGFYVIGNHSYTNPGAYTASVTITNADGASTSTTSTIDVTTQGIFTATVYIGDDGGATTTATLTVNVTAPVINATTEDLSAQEGIPLTNVVVATFTAPSQGIYSATVAWGDGNQDIATVTGSNGVYSVIDTHMYTEDGSYTATVAITDPNGISTQTVSDPVSVADAALTATDPTGEGYLTTTAGVACIGSARTGTSPSRE